MAKAVLCDRCASPMQKGETYLHVKVFEQTDGLQRLRREFDLHLGCSKQPDTRAVIQVAAALPAPPPGNMTASTQCALCEAPRAGSSLFCEAHRAGQP